MWRIIPGTDNLYLANEQGEIRSMPRPRYYNSHGTSTGYYMRNGKILKQTLNSKGYPCVTIKYLDGSQKVTTVHQLVASAFIPNPENLPQINHKDGNKTNNNVRNLEWCSARDNLIHAYKTGLNKGSHHMIGKCGKLHHNSIPVIAYYPNGEIYKEYESANLAALDMGLSSSSHISACIHGKRKTAKGFIWRIKIDQ